MKCYVGSLKLKRAQTLGVNTKSVGLRIKPPEAALKDGEAPLDKYEKTGE